MQYYIGADLGTSALKLLLVDRCGKVVKTVSKSYDVSYPAPGWSEQNPEDWWDALCSGIQELTEGISKEGICGISTAGQMHGLVALDKEDNVLRPAILWNDGRTAEETEYLNTVIGKEKLSSLTANIAFAGFTAPKILWMQKHEKEKFDRIDKIMLPKDYITYRLTGKHVTDYSDASGMLLLDVANKCWSDEMIAFCGLKKDQLPQLLESYARLAILPETAALLGLSPSCVVAPGAGDNAGAAIGTGTVSEGKCNISLGTSGTIFISSERFSVDCFNALHSFCHSDGGFHLMGCMLSAASCNKWFCEDILKTEDYAYEQAEISDDHLGNNHVYFLPYLMGERSPLNDTDARGVFIGMRPDTERRHMVQAVLEGVAFAMRDNLEIAKSLGIPIFASTLCGGGAKSPLWQKIISNVLNLKISLPACEEGPGYGAAMLAMVADGAYPSVSACADALCETRGSIMPDSAIAARYQAQYQKFRKIYPALKDVYKEIKEEQ